MARVSRNRSSSILDFGALIYRLNASSKCREQNLENIKKQVQLHNGLMFNITCLLETLLDDNTNIYKHMSIMIALYIYECLEIFDVHEVCAIVLTDNRSR